MVKELMHDPIFLAGKSEVATKEDLQVAKDLLDTLMAHGESCVGMAANMIGVRGALLLPTAIMTCVLFMPAPRKFYLRLDKTRDVIEWQLDDTLDINGWDIQKALTLIRNVLPTIRKRIRDSVWSVEVIFYG